jgi:HD superfamily phosphohydrolase
MKTIYDNVHRRYTTWPSPLVELINTPEFQRLKRIKQLSACHHVFPGATHTRFEHSLGVGFLAASFVRALARNQPGLVVRLDEGGDDTDGGIEAVVLAFQLAGLCHDLGHATLSHGFDTLVSTFDPPAPAHEARSVALLRHLVRAYALPLPPAVVDAACELIHPQRNAGPTLPAWWYQIIANDHDSIDVDKFDYLLRDAHALGIGGLDVDVERFTEYARVCAVGGGACGDGRLCLSYPTKLQFDVNQLFLARHRLHAQVYQHPAVRAVERMLQDYLVCLAAPLQEDLAACATDPTRLCPWTDDVFTRPFLELLVAQGRVSQSRAGEALTLLERVERRQLYRSVAEVRIPRQLAVDATHALDAVSAVAKVDAEGAALVGAAAWAKDWYADPVVIGYALNPLYKVRFYEVDAHGHVQPAKHVPLLQSSYTFPVCSRDTVVRVYNKGVARPDEATCEAVRRAALRALTPV